MDLRQMEFAVVLAEELNFRKAACRLNISQPPFSRQIKLLEEELGTSLFNRNRNRVQITLAGEVFVRESRRILDKARLLKKNMRGFRNDRSGKLKIGFVTMAGFGFIPQLAENLKNLGYELELADYLDNQSLVESLEEKEIHCAFHHPVQLSRQLSSVTLFEEPIVLITCANHPLYNKESVTIKDFALESCLLPPRSTNPVLCESLEYKMRESDHGFAFTQHINDCYGRLSLVASGMGITFDRMGILKLNVPNLVYREQHPFDTITVKLTYSWRRDEPPAAHSPIIDFFRKGKRIPAVSRMPIPALA
ncbi:MAG: LysR family transcriptional regulator [Bacteroidota bacterium]